MGKHFVSTEVDVDIKWREELVDSGGSNFYIRLSPVATLKKTAIMDASGAIKSLLTETKQEMKGKFKNLKVK